MFAVTVTSIIDYLFPKDQTELDTLGFSSEKITSLIEEKSDVVYSYLPERYKKFFRGRVLGLIAVESAYDGQTSIAAPFPTATNIKSSRNGGAKESISTSSTWTFSELSEGDKLVVDFDIDITQVSIPALASAVKSLVAAEILKVASENIQDGSIIERVRTEENIVEWLENLRSNEIKKAVSIRQLDYKFTEDESILIAFSNKVKSSGWGE